LRIQGTIRRIILVTAVLMNMAVLVGCPTRYGPMGIKGGYDSYSLDRDLTVVTFKGNGYCSNEYVQRMALFRAAEIAREKGFSYLIVVDERQSTKTQYTSGTFEVETKGNYSRGTYSPPYEIEKHTATITVRFANERSDDTQSISVDSLLSSLGTEVARRRGLNTCPGCCIPW
jgi:hypothetical protein